MSAIVIKKRCAVYTRVSTDERLDQSFNSLDAQREAGNAYITSQRAEGWLAVADDYDDGGYSGGNVERPALKRLMIEIAAGNVDIVVVYKIDRLTRSLADFSRLIEIFERHKVSFVSVSYRDGRQGNRANHANLGAAEPGQDDRAPAHGLLCQCGVDRQQRCAAGALHADSGQLREAATQSTSVMVAWLQDRFQQTRLLPPVPPA